MGPLLGLQRLSSVWGLQAGPRLPASLPTLFKVEFSAGRWLTLFDELDWLRGLRGAAEKPARAGGSLQPEGGARASLEEGKASGLFAALVQVLNVYILWGQGRGCGWGCCFECQP